MEGYGRDRGPRRYGGGGFDGPQRSFAPVNVGDVLDVKIESVGAKGDGVAKVKGFVLFVPGVQQGQEVKVKVTRVLRKAGFAEVVGSGSASTEAPAEESSEEVSEEAPLEESSEEVTEEAPAEEASDSEDFGDEEAQ
ncbi:MAG: TRAM domain-containing protein [Candidatus Nanoarchaeia archaeon]